MSVLSAAQAEPYDLCVLGGGASGLMVLWHLCQQPAPPRRILWLDETGRLGRGPAYATRWPQHLLNVPAARMSLRPDRPEDFLHWLNGPEGQRQAATHDLPTHWPGDAFAPRLLFGAYLDAFQRELEAWVAKAGGVLHKIVAHIDTVTAEAGGYVLQGAQQSWRARDLLLAMGNRPAPPWRIPQQNGADHPGWLGRMWDWAAAPPAPLPASLAPGLPAVILGSGLTGVDAWLQLRASGWQGTIQMLSRRAALPAAHAEMPLPPAQLPGWPPPGARLSTYLRTFRRAVRPLPDWRAGLDALRPHTADLWQRLSAEDQRRFWSRLGHHWNIHRHRMAPGLARLLEAERASGQLQLRAFTIADLRGAESGIDILGPSGKVRAALVVDCTGPSYDLRRQPGPLKPLLEAGILHLAPNGLGLAMEADGLAHGAPIGGGRIVALGALGVGMRWESVAIPELRQQAAQAALALSAPFP